MIKLTLICGDALKILPALLDESIDLIIADFPYNISNCSSSLTKVGSKIVRADFGEWDKFSEEEYENLIIKVSKEFERILKPQCQAYMFFDNHYAGHYVWLIEKNTTLRQKCPIVLYKKNPIPHVRYTNFRSSFDMCILFTKDLDKKCKTFNFLSQQIMKNVMEYNLDKKTEHPTEKNENIIERFIKISSNEGEIILDPFLGSGTTMDACLRLKRNCIGIEIDKKYIEITKKRLNWGSSLSDKIEWEFKDMSD
jgi:DNA modification methylase